MVVSLYLVLFTILLTFALLALAEKVEAYVGKTRKHKKGGVTPEQAPAVLVFDK